jgi:hypothetical protein
MIFVTFIEQKGECIIRYFGRPCDEFAERVWPIKISDGARVTLFNKGLVSCDVNQSFLLLLFEWEYVSFMMISCIFCYRRYCMMWRHLAPPPLWVSWDIVWLLTIEKTRKHDTIVVISLLYCNTPLKRGYLLWSKKFPHKEISLFRGGQFSTCSIFLNASEIWHADKRSDLWLEGLYKTETTVFDVNFYFSRVSQ